MRRVRNCVLCVPYGVNTRADGGRENLFIFIIDLKLKIFFLGAARV